MIFAYYELALTYLALTVVFWPVFFALLITSLLCLPSKLVGDTCEDFRAHEGNPFVTLVSTVALVAVTWHYSGLHVVKWDTTATVSFVFLVFAYVVLGFTWAFLSWRSLCVKRADYLKQRIMLWADNNSISYEQLKNDTAPDALRVKFFLWMFDYTTNPTFRGNRPGMEAIPNTDDLNVNQRWKPLPWKTIMAPFVIQPQDYKAHLTSWVVCWPLSVLKWIVGPALSDVVNTVYNLCKDRLQQVANSAFKDL